MACSIKPFRGTHYNKKIIKNLTSVACPPYDVINAAGLTKMRNASLYNFTRILIADNKNYQACAKNFKAWQKQNILIDDTQPCLYVYEQQFTHAGKKHTRFGIFALLKMESHICPHEHTLAKPKQDRARMIRAVQANLSPIFTIIPKKVPALHALYKAQTRKKPFFSFIDCDKNRNRLWRVETPSEIEAIRSHIEKNKLVIADGHHRFEISYEYYLKNKKLFSDLDYIFAFITDDQKGLLILPTHRVVTIKEDTAALIRGLERQCSVQRVTRQQLVKRLAGDTGIFSCGMYHKGAFYFCRLRSAHSLADMPGTPELKQLNTYILHHAILSRLTLTGDTQYTHTIPEAISLAGTDKTAFILRGIPLRVIFSLANKGCKFPQKSTYFYPKLFSGIIMRRFVRENF